MIYFDGNFTFIMNKGGEKIMEKIPIPTETWKGLKKLEFEARRIIVKHVESLAKRPEFEKEIAIIDDYPRVRLKCLLWPWLPQCPPFDICRRYPWLCPPFCFLPPCPIPCKLCPPIDIVPPDWRYRVDPVVAIDAIMYRLPDVKPEMITEDAVLKASIGVMEEGINLIRKSLDRVSESLKKFK